MRATWFPAIPAAGSIPGARPRMLLTLGRLAGTRSARISASGQRVASAVAIPTPPSWGRSSAWPCRLASNRSFSPYYHPESNGTVERFHRDYARFVWEKAHLSDLAGVQQRSGLFFQNYRTSRHHSRLAGRSPEGVQRETPPQRTIPADFRLPEQLPLIAGQVHFIRAVDEAGKVKVLNLPWEVTRAQPPQGVWVTLNLTPQGATLLVFDQAPDAPKRRLLARHPFPLREEVVPLTPEFQGRPRRRKFSPSGIWWEH